MSKQAKIDVILNNEQVRARLAEITTDLKVLKTLKDKAFAEGDVKGFNQLNTEYKKLTTEAGKFAKQNVDVNSVLKNLSSASIRELNQVYQQTNKELKEMKRNDPGYAEKQKQVTSLKTEIDKTTASIRQHQTATQKLSGYFKELLPALGATAVLGFFVNLGSQIFSVQEKFQTFSAVLKTALGSKGAAAASLQMIQDFAAKTPFSVEQLTGSFIKLVNRGFKPTKEELTKMGDLASTSGKAFDMLVEAILDAETGEFERLKEFGIKAKVSGDQVTMTFKGVKTTMDNNAESIRAYILVLGDLNGVMGSMAEISGTLAGKTSNLGDSWTTFIKTLGDNNSGVFSTVINGLTNIVTAATLAIKTLKQIKNEAEISNASDNVQESMREIEVMTASLVKNGVNLNEAKKQAYQLYLAERNNQLNDLNRDILTTDVQLKVYSVGINGIKAGKVMYNLLSSKSDFESRKRMLVEEVEQIKTLKDAQIDYSTQAVNYAKLSTKELNKLIKGGDELAKSELTTRKSANDALKDALKILEDQISEFDSKINKAIVDGNLPLANKFTEEKKSAEDLLETYKLVKEQLAMGWLIPERDPNGAFALDIESLVSVGAKIVKPSISDKSVKNSLQKLNTGLGEATPQEAAQAVRDRVAAEEATKKDLNDQIKEASFATATELNNTVFDIVKNRQQAEFDHKMSLLEKEKEAELSNAKLTDAEKIAINEKYRKKEAAIKTANFKKEQNASAIQALINGALGITKTFAVMGFTPPAWVAAAALAATTLIEVIAIKSAKPPEYYEGGFTNQDFNDKKPTGIVHANEFIGTADAVRNPSVKPFFDVIDYAQRNGTISQINLQPINVSGKKEFRSGGYTTSKMIDPTQINQPGSGAGNQLSNEALSITRTIAREIAKEFKKGITGRWYLHDLEKIQNNKADIDSATKL